MLTYYDRAVGIVCLESDVFEHEADLSKLLGLLPASPLIWQWSSTRRYPVHPRYAGLELPAQRDWTRLTSLSLDLLAADLVEQDLNDDRRQVLLIGSDRDLIGTLSNTEEAGSVLEDFAAERPPVRMAVVQLGDTGSSFIFMPRHPSRSVQHLLEGWGVSIASARKRLPYGQLHLARFEALFGLRMAP
ncbi:MAG: hypothetical protein KBF17_11240 [Candidatus Promineofilum sp.]|nr:hypothetical protein [Promineifilum sp.]